MFGWMVRTPYCLWLRKPSLKLNHYFMEYDGNHCPGAVYELWSFPRPCFLMSQTAGTLLVIFSAISKSPVTETVSVLADAVIYVFLSLLWLLGHPKVSSRHCPKGYFTRLHLFSTQRNRTYLWSVVWYFNTCITSVATRLGPLAYLLPQTYILLWEHSKASVITILKY